MRKFIFLFLLSVVWIADAKTYPLLPGQEVVGQVQTVVTKPGDTLPQVARDYDMGYVEMEEANPGITDPDHLVPGTVLVIPSHFVLPNAPHNGIVVNLPEMRLYYYPKGKNVVATYPIGIGREGENTLVGAFTIIQRTVNPTWTATEEMRKLRAKEGVILPKNVPPGPENPLGKYRLRLSNPTYLIHGTNEPLGGIGRRSSSGCMRLYPEDIERLFHSVSNGTLVYIVDEPYKAGWSASGELYLESHLALDAQSDKTQEMAQIRQVIAHATRNRSADIDWDKVNDIGGETQGFPQVVGVQIDG